MGKSEKKIGTKSSVNNQKPDVAVKKDDYSQVENNSEDSNSRNIILQTALKLFSERNYRAVTISDIAKETKIIQKSTIFYHFKTKLNLANKAIEFFMTEFEKEEFFAFMNLADPIEKLRHIIKGMLKVLEIYPKFGRFILDVIEANEEETEQQSSPSMDNQWIPFAVQMYEMVVSLFSECGVSNPGARALILLSSLDGDGILYSLNARSTFIRVLYRFKCDRRVYHRIIKVFTLRFDLFERKKE